MRERRLAREVAVQSLYEATQANVTFTQAVRANVERRQGSEAVKDYAMRILQSLEEHGPRAEKEICEAMENWTWERVSLVNRCVLQVGVTELFDFKDVPVQVVIDEAIEIARKFGSPESGAFVNGVLDRIAKKSDGAPE